MIWPSWLAGALAAAVTGVALFSAGRLIASRRRRGEVDADGMHVLMGAAMAGMFVPRLAILPVPAWEVIFACGAGWFGWRAVSARRGGRTGQSGHGLAGLSGAAGPGHLGMHGRCCRYPLPHFADCAAMLYALWAVPALRSAGPAVNNGMGGAGGGAGGVRLPALGLILVVCVCGYVVWLGDRLPPVPSRAVAAARPPGPAGPAAATAPAASLALLAPRAATCCKIAMGVAMGVMLINLV